MVGFLAVVPLGCWTGHGVAWLYLPGSLFFLMGQGAAHLSGVSAVVSMRLGGYHWGSVSPFTSVLRIPVVDRSVGGLPSRWGWSYTAIPTQSSQATGKGVAG